MNTSKNNYDTIEELIFTQGLQIQVVNFHLELDLMLIVLNTKAILHQKISAYPALKNSSEESLKKYELIANGTGINWPLLNEDLSLKGFLKDELVQFVGGKKTIAA